MHSVQSFGDQSEYSIEISTFISDIRFNYMIIDLFLCHERLELSITQNDFISHTTLQLAFCFPFAMGA